MVGLIPPERDPAPEVAVGKPHTAPPQTHRQAARRAVPPGGRYAPHHRRSHPEHLRRHPRARPHDGPPSQRWSTASSSSHSLSWPWASAASSRHCSPTRAASPSAAMNVAMPALLFGAFALLEQQAVKPVAGQAWFCGALLALWGAYELRPARR